MCSMEIEIDLGLKCRDVWVFKQLSRVMLGHVADPPTEVPVEELHSGREVMRDHKEEKYLQK